MLAVGAILFSSIQIMPSMVQTSYGYTATLSGLVLMPGGLTMLCLMPISGLITNYIQPKYLISAGILIMALGLWHMTSLTPDASFQYFEWARVYQTAGLPYLFIPITTASYVGLPREKTNEAASVINVARNLGGSIGVSLSTALLVQREQFHQSRLVESIYPSSIQFQNTFKQLISYFAAQGASAVDAQYKSIAWVGQQVAHQAILLSYIDVFWALGALAMSMIPIVLILLRADEGPVAAR
jgi:MFS transporter, DHA2 family, multidrug resistance protein